LAKPSCGIARIASLGEYTKADVVSVRVEDGDKVQIEGVTRRRKSLQSASAGQVG
jgi:hypothetical protein